MKFLRVLWLRIRYAGWLLNWRLMFSIAEWRTVRGIRVGVYAVWDDHVEARLFERIESALGLIATYEPRRLERMARDIGRIWVRRTDYATAYYVQALEMCVIDLRFVNGERTTSAAIAAELVHEATHARLFKWGVRYAEAERRRIELICITESTAFARRLPDGEAVARHIEDCLPSDTSHWSNERLSRRKLDADLREVDEAPIPGWLKRFLRRVIVSRAA